MISHNFFCRNPVVVVVRKGKGRVCRCPSLSGKFSSFFFVLSSFLYFTKGKRRQTLLDTGGRREKEA